MKRLAMPVKIRRRSTACQSESSERGQKRPAFHYRCLAPYSLGQVCPSQPPTTSHQVGQTPVGPAMAQAHYRTEVACNTCAERVEMACRHPAIDSAAGAIRHALAAVRDTQPATPARTLLLVGRSRYHRPSKLVIRVRLLSPASNSQPLPTIGLPGQRCGPNTSAGTENTGGTSPTTTTPRLRPGRRHPPPARGNTAESLIAGSAAGKPSEVHPSDFLLHATPSPG